MNFLFFIKKTIHRKILEEKLAEIAPKLTGKILDIGSKDARYANLLKGEVISVDVIPNPAKKVLKGDIYSLDFPKETFDGVLSTEVFQYLEDPKKAISEIYRVLEKEGVLLLSCPLIYRVHGDLVRYTEDFLRKLLANFSKVEFFYLGNFYTIILDTIREKIVKLPIAIFRYFFYIPFFILTLLIPLSLKFSKDRNFVSGYLIRVSK